ncbi:choloylglycine hydrolase family protein [Amaricoccus sp.]|uniref:choloylglycine hydrolase family protein n=1 Tax=Amaricoccus sp. TaxID=1872485 RepID=UPI001B456DAA|nr:choloylglycine hydrolase family protein [Amaricoccus sp.]MBP7242042.1 choloylglycine hydrolase family protein [Amaricoccus sp.]
MLRALATGLAILGAAQPALACTAVDITAADRSVVAGRTMEWAYDMDWTLRSFPKGTTLSLTAPPDLGLPAHEVATTHAFVGVSAEIIPGGAVLEGQNDAGLGMSGNFLPGFTEYQTVTKADASYVSILTFGSWALGMHGSVAEIRAALPGTKVWADSSLPSGPTPPTIHMVFTDRGGDSVIVEYVGGELRMHDNVAGVLTNAPTYDWHLLNARNYLSLSTVGVESRRIGDVDVTAIGQGGGLVGLPGDYTPPSRFLRAAFLRHAVETPEDADAAVQAVAHILNTVDIPLGVAQSKAGDRVISDYTQWVAIKDLTNNRLHIADYAHRTTYLTLDLGTIFAQENPAAVRVDKLPYPASIDGTAALVN